MESQLHSSLTSIGGWLWQKIIEFHIPVELSDEVLYRNLDRLLSKEGQMVPPEERGRLIEFPTAIKKSA
jgi:hypothetical protein